MIEFPETARLEWDIIADAANAEIELRERIEQDTLVEKELKNLRIRYIAKVALEYELNADMTPDLKMISGLDYLNNPASLVTPPDLIDGVLKDEGLCVVLGPSGSGKTTLVLQMLHSLNAGVDWLAQDVTQIKGSVGFLSYDQAASITFGWLNASGFDMSKINLVDAYKTGNPLGVPAMRAQIVAAWKKAGVEIVVLDSFSASYFGQDQNDAAATMQHYRDLKAFALAEVGARALIVLAHSTASNPNTARGSTVHQDVADSIMTVKGTGADPREIRMVKYRALPGQYQMNPIVVTAPDTVTHLVSLDPGAMTLAGMSLPPTATAMVFPDLPDPTEAPDTDSDMEDENL